MGLYCLESSMRPTCLKFVVLYDHVRHHCRLIHSCGSPGRLSFALRGACNIIVIFIMLLLGKQRETIQGHYCGSPGRLVTTLLSLRVICTYASNPPTRRDCHHLRSQALATSLSSYGTRAVFSFTHMFL
jgi:hypothetical protein